MFLLFQRNDFVTSECEAFEKIQNLLKNRREPIFKSKEPEEIPTSGRETATASHSKTRTGSYKTKDFIEKKIPNLSLSSRNETLNERL